MRTRKSPWRIFAGTYGVEITDGEDDVLILVAAIVIDMTCANSRH